MAITDRYNKGGHFLFGDWHVAHMSKEVVMADLDNYFRPDKTR